MKEQDSKKTSFKRKGAGVGEAGFEQDVTSRIACGNFLQNGHAASARQGSLIVYGG